MCFLEVKCIIIVIKDDETIRNRVKTIDRLMFIRSSLNIISRFCLQVTLFKCGESNAQTSLKQVMLVELSSLNCSHWLRADGQQTHGRIPLRTPFK